MGSDRIILMNRIKKTYPSYYYFEKDDIKKLCKELASIGLSTQSWKVPTNGRYDLGDGILTTEKYFSLNYNFAAVIGVFENPTNKDIVKILFVNVSGAKKTFNDFTFPNSESEGPKYSIESVDEIRANGMNNYIRKTLKTINRNDAPQYVFVSILNLISFIYVILFFFLFENINRSYPALAPASVILLVMAVIIVVFYFVSIKRGVYINSFPHPLVSFVDQMIKGSFKENPITYIFLKLLAASVVGIIGGYALSLFQAAF
ncbi:MAG: hypothetical protein JWO54_150 [Candidatus Saccharibacteria bacterium]|nr:hypothetical protein [Candidatus Saccharibacteria bacterium]MDB5180392.1 hypothetical protein [Candidatus Saccharibacteria bacterium]